MARELQFQCSQESNLGDQAALSTLPSALDAGWSASANIVVVVVFEVAVVVVVVVVVGVLIVVIVVVAVVVVAAVGIAIVRGHLVASCHHVFCNLGTSSFVAS